MTPHPHMKFGRKPRKPSAARVHLSDFISHREMPIIPASCDFTPKGGAAMSDVMGNDTLGDCVVAAGYHLVALETGNATGSPFRASPSQIVADYAAIGGYVPGDPSTDNGCNEADAFAYWKAHGFANGTKLLGAISINGMNKADVQAAMFLFENLFFGVGLPDAWLNPWPSGNGFVWSGVGPHAADPNNGHAFLGTGFDDLGVKIDTWGLIGHITWAAISNYATNNGGGELYALLTPDQLAKGQAKAPNGVDWSALVQAFDDKGGNVPVPAPPAPPPAPVPVVKTCTLAQAQAILSAGWPK
jgi:hypothetical protein